MEVVELVKSSGEGNDVKMTAFVNLGNEEQMVAVNQEMVEAMKEGDGETSEKLMKATKKASKKEKLVAMAMSRLKKMEMGMDGDGEGGDMRMANMMRLIALQPQIIGPVVEVRHCYNFFVVISISISIVLIR